MAVIADFMSVTGAWPVGVAGTGTLLVTTESSKFLPSLFSAVIANPQVQVSPPVSWVGGGVRQFSRSGLPLMVLIAKFPLVPFTCRSSVMEIFPKVDLAVNLIA